jgi:hypothetical protein
MSVTDGDQIGTPDEVLLSSRPGTDDSRFSSNFASRVPDKFPRQDRGTSRVTTRATPPDRLTQLRLHPSSGTARNTPAQAYPPVKLPSLRQLISIHLDKGMVESTMVPALRAMVCIRKSRVRVSGSNTRGGTSRHGLLTRTLDRNTSNPPPRPRAD